MLRSFKDLEDYAIGATDGRIGHVSDIYFDDQDWVVRYLVVDTGNWLDQRKVLISPIAIQSPNWAARLLPVSLTQEQVRNSPDINTEQPVSRQQEAQQLDYYGYGHYWEGSGLWGMGMSPLSMAPMGMMPDYLMLEPVHNSQAEEQRIQQEAVQEQQQDNAHLRSGKEVINYRIQARDGDIGHVESLIMDEESWAIRYLVINTSNWWMGHQVLIAPPWVESVSWADKTVAVGLTRDAVKAAPPYDSSSALNRQLENQLHEHYGQKAYWLAESLPLPPR